MPESINYGISGAQHVTAHNIAVGPHASIVVNAADPAVQAGLGDLIAAVRAFDGPPEARADLAAAAEDVRVELEQPEPDRRRLRDRLEAITATAGATGAVASAATALLGLIV